MSTERTATGTDAEFTAFVTRSGPGLRRTARLLAGDEHRADDLVQATLVKTYLAWPRARATDPEAYARRVLANHRVDTWRKHRREVLTDPAEVPEGAPERPDPVGQAAGDRDEVLRALLTLTERQRRIVVLRHLVGLTDAEVAHDLGVSPGTVKSTASRALAQLRAELAPHADREPVPALLEVAAAGEPHDPAATAGAAIAGAAAVRRRRRTIATAGVALAALVGLVVGVGALRPLVGGGTASADYPVYATLADLAAHSDAVVEGTVLDARRTRLDVLLGPGEEYLPYVVYRVRVTDVFAGDVAVGDVLDAAVLAGGSPEAGLPLDVDARYVLFLGPAFEGGTRHVLNPFESVYRVADDGTLVPVSTDPELALPLTRAELEGLTP